MVFFILILSALGWMSLHLQETVAALLQNSHRFCLERIPLSPSSQVISALMCGEHIRTAEFTDFFSRSGLYHLIVVSKAHLEILSTGLLLLGSHTNMGKLRWLLLVPLLLYLSMVGPQAPLVRTLIFLLLSALAWKFRWGWSPLFTLMIATCLSLAFDFEWYSSLSLLHSSGCALGFLLAREIVSARWKQLLFAFLFTLPFLWGWANIHPLTMLINWTLAPILLTIWLSFSLISFIWPDSHPLADWVIMNSIDWSAKILEPIPANTAEDHIPPHWLWLFFWWAALSGWAWKLWRARNPPRVIHV